MSELGMLDILIVFVTISGMVQGFKSGLVQSIISLLGWFIALVLGTRLAPVFAPSFSNVVNSEILQLACGFLTVVLMVITLLHIVAAVLSRVLNELNLSIVDKIAGGVLGAIKSIIVLLIFLSVSSPLLIKTSLWQNSVLTPELLPYAPIAKKVMKDTLGDAWKTIDVKK